MQLAVAMGDEGSGRHLFSLCDAASWVGARRTGIIILFCWLLQALEYAATAFTPQAALMSITKTPSLGRRPHDFMPVLDAANQIILGKENEVKLAAACLLAGGHLLLEDLPGLGKTTLAHTLARLLGLNFARIQFTADLLPADITGVSIFDRERSDFRFIQGPVFSQLVLADEINRATPKTQSALLEAMEEGQVSIEGETRALPKPFFVIATQNPTHQIGTFPLPESQLDRFLMRIELGYPGRDAERALLASGGRRTRADQLDRVLAPERLMQLQNEVADLYAAPPLIDYVQALLEASRHTSLFRHGLSPRAGLALLAAARAWAWLAGRDIVLPDDVQAVFPSVARHRLASAQGGGQASNIDVDALIKSVAIP